MVDDSSDCIIRGSSPADVDPVDFDSRLVASTAAVSDGTRFRSSRRPVVVPTVQPRDITSSLKSTLSSTIGPDTNDPTETESTGRTVPVELTYRMASPRMTFEVSHRTCCRSFQIRMAG